MTTYSIESTINSRIAAIESNLNQALIRLNGILTSAIFYGSPTVIAGQSSGAAGGTTPSITADKPKKPKLDRSNTALDGKYISTFKMPAVVTINDTPPPNNWKLNWQEKQYAEWILTDVKSKISDGFDDIGILNSMEAQIWARRDSRLATASTDALTRSSIRWTQRKAQDTAESISARSEEIATTFNYTVLDGIKDQTIKRAELKDASRKHSIGAGLQGEGIYISLQEGFAMRLLDAVDQTASMAVQYYKGLLSYYTDVTVQEYLNQLLHYSEGMTIGIDKKKADIKRYISNTRNIMSRNKKNILEYDSDIDAFSSKAYLNESKAQLTTMYNKLSLEELLENNSLLITQIKSNMDGFQQAMRTNQWFSEMISKAFAQYVSAASQSINLMVQAATKFDEDVTP